MKRSTHRHRQKVLVLASAASMIDQFNMPNIRLLQELGYEVHVACNFLEGNTCDNARIQKLQNTLEAEDVIWHQWDCPRSIRPVHKCICAYRQLWELTGRYRFAWLHCHSPIGGALARIAAHARKIRVIYTAHGFHFYHGAPLWNWILYYPAEKLLSYWTDGLIVINQEDYRIAKNRMYMKKLYPVPGIGIDVGRIQEACKSSKSANIAARRECGLKYRIPEHAVLLLSVGELSSRKNHQVVLTALAMMGRRDVYYLICGQGELQEELLRQAKALGIAERVRMAGFLEDLTQIYGAADLFVFPSRQEGLPAALMEAMAAGLPCVVSDIRGNRELIRGTGQPETAGGILAAPDQPGALCKALEYMLDHPKFMEKCAENNQKNIWNYDRRIVQQQMRGIYTRMQQRERDRT